MPIYDFNNNVQGINFEYDYCIIGGGVVGLSTAVKLAQKLKNKSIVVLESGGESPGKAQIANDGEIIGNTAYSLISSRMRGLGGTQLVWGGNSRPFSPYDFEERHWIANSGWPISYSEYYKYLKSATIDLDIDNSDWSYKHPELKHIKLLHKDFFHHTHYKLSPQIVHNSSRATGTFYQSKNKLIKSLSNLHIIINSTVSNLEFNQDNSIFSGLVIKNLINKSAKIKSKNFIFASGALENARLLKYFCDLDHGPKLECYDSIGRYFMEHPHRRINLILSPDEVKFKFNDYFGKIIGSSLHQARFRLSDTMQSKSLLNSIDVSILAPKRKKLFKNIFSPEHMLEVVLLMEQEPNIFNRIELTTEKDIFGIPKIKLHWKLSEQDWKSLESVSSIVDRFIGANNIGRSKSIKLNRKQIIRGGHHHMGTTRMGLTPKNSVVDSNCKVFGIKNVYMSGGSVFTTSGSANPTINMLALAHRLVDYLVKNEY